MAQDAKSASSEELLKTFARTRDKALRARLIEEHLQIVERLAKRFANRGEPVADLIQAGSIGLINAVDRFNPELGYPFAAYATTMIVGELKRHFRDRGWSIRASRRVQELYLELGPVLEVLYQRHKRSPTVAEIATELEVSEDDVLEAMEAGSNYRADSLDAPNPEGGTLSDRVSTEEAGFEAVEGRVALMPRLAELSERDRQVIEMRFIEGLNQSEIASRLGISQMHVSRLLARSIAALQRSLNAPAKASANRPEAGD